MPSRILTLESTSPESFEDITTGIAAQTIILRHYRADLDVTAQEAGTRPYHRVFNIELGPVIGTNFVIDDDAGFNYLKIGLDHQPSWTQPAIGAEPGYKCQTTVRDCCLPFTMSGDLPKNFSLRIRDNNHKLIPLTAFKYLMLQFELTS
ncbi:hypothetical protein BASA81_018247 [Batrachochytrium salamandrivorans]|nr:hypothetical protein BASA81_018247 [Batrachochytrium salamandrivorans]